MMNFNDVERFSKMDWELGKLEGREEGGKDAKRRFVVNLLKEVNMSPEKIASLAGVSVTEVFEVKQKMLIDQLAEQKKKQLLKEGRSRSWCDDYSERYAQQVLRGYREGLQHGMTLLSRLVVDNLSKEASFSEVEIARIIGNSVDWVRRARSNGTSRR